MSPRTATSAVVRTGRLAVTGKTPSPVRLIVFAFSTHAIASARPFGPRPKLFRTSFLFTRLRADQLSLPGTLSYTPLTGAGFRAMYHTPVSQADGGVLSRAKVVSGLFALSSARSTVIQM